MVNLMEEPFERAAELHGFVRRHMDGVLVDFGETEVDDDSVPAIPLGYDA